ncbi:uncharacterized protein SCHCODRAFT_01058497, partial [Schizophyllum commune H4-8]|uniref:uncharacterized protein n=1 Tax=Schizophyllum commune (strain H4-8 / FGSC 9210) TaxID=578458 RepID=UPI002161025D
YEGVFTRQPAILLRMEPEEAKEFVDEYLQELYWERRWKDANDESTTFTPGRRFHKTEDGLLFFLDADFLPRLCVPDKLVPRILRAAHEEPMECAHG